MDYTRANTANNMKKQKILLTGGSGLLGKEILKLDKKIFAPLREEMDISNFKKVEVVFKKYKPDIVLHLAAATKPPEHEKNPEVGILNNIVGTANIALACVRHGARLVYTSTDYLYVGRGPHKETEPIFPPYKFAWSKLGGECSVAVLPNSLILRLSFGPKPFPWNKVYSGQYSSKLYVDEMAKLVLKATKSKVTGIMNIGGERTTLEKYAKRTRPGISIIPKPNWVPKDTSLDLTKMRKFL